jgi:hypothetical protein
MKNSELKIKDETRVPEHIYFVDGTYTLPNFSMGFAKTLFRPKPF